MKKHRHYFDEKGRRVTECHIEHFAIDDPIHKGYKMLCVVLPAEMVTGSYIKLWMKRTERKKTKGKAKA